jgi:hypothetical protein
MSGVKVEGMSPPRSECVIESEPSVLSGPLRGEAENHEVRWLLKEFGGHRGDKIGHVQIQWKTICALDEGIHAPARRRGDEVLAARGRPIGIDGTGIVLQEGAAQAISANEGFS